MSNISGWSIAETLLPMFYGSIIYIILSILFNDTAKTEVHSKNNITAENPIDLMSTIIAEQVFKEFNLTGRECHVALKLLEDTPNKEIAAQLYISETTVKKHIQNIYRKFGATCRNDFQEIYIQHAGKK
jgi:DNA-binding NarL/FixJ family response regulator